MKRKGLRLPCEKCGEIIEFHGISLPGQTCPKCGASRPHTFWAHPIVPFLFFFGGCICFGMINPLGWSQDAMFHIFFGSFILMFWFKALRPIHRALRSTSMDENESIDSPSKVFGCISNFILGVGILSIFAFFLTCEGPERIYYDNTPYFELQAYPIPFDSNDTATPVFDAKGRIVPVVNAGPDTFPVSSVSGEETEISFTNRMEFHVRVYRIDANGSALSLNYLEQNQGSLPMKTYAGQTWLVTDIDGRPVFYFIAEKGLEGEVGSARILPDNWEDR